MDHSRDAFDAFSYHTGGLSRSRAGFLLFQGREFWVVVLTDTYGQIVHTMAMVWN